MTAAVPRVEYLRVRNFRALRDVEFKGLSPLTVLLGQNGSGKSTVFDVLAFLAECFDSGLRPAWEKRNRFRELRTRGQSGPIIIEVKYREKSKTPLITYHLEIDELRGSPIVSKEWMHWKRGQHGRPFKFLDFADGSGIVVSGELPEADDERHEERLASSDLLAVNALGQFTSNPRVQALRSFVTGWYLSYVSAAATRGVPESGPQERLSATGDNLPNVIQHLHERHPERLEELLSTLSRRVPRLENVIPKVLEDGRLMMQVKDAPFDDPILAKFASDGTLKMLAYLTVLYDPSPAPFIGIEEPENQLYPLLMPGLAEECRLAAGRSQVLVTTHSPEFVSALNPEELWLLGRDREGYTFAKHTSTDGNVLAHLDAGATLGDLWMEGYLSVPDEGQRR